MLTPRWFSSRLMFPLCIVGSLALVAASAQAQSDPPQTPFPPATAPNQVHEYVPTGPEIQMAVIKRQGGRAAIAALVARSAKGTVEVRVRQDPKAEPVTVAKGTIDIDIASGSRSLIVTHLSSASDGKDLGTIKQGSDGKTAWSIDPTSGVRVLSGVDRAQYLDSVALDYELTLLDKYPSAVVHSNELLEGRGVMRVEYANLTEKGPVRFLEYGTGKVFRTDQRVSAPSGDTMMVETSFDDYRKVGSVLVPFLIRAKRGPMEQVVRILECTHPAKADDKLFELPPEVVKAQSERAAPPAKPTGGSTPGAPSRP
jgi:hypothetical protein